MRVLLVFFFLVVVTSGCKEKITPTNQNTVQDYKNVDVMGAKNLISQKTEIIILDVRTPAETAKGMLPEAIEIDYNNSNFDAEIAKLDKSKSYLVYCKSGGRSARASKKMIKAGFSDITNMKGGYNAWSKN